jgi:hypothetical protein
MTLAALVPGAGGEAREDMHVSFVLVSTCHGDYVSLN